MKSEAETFCAEITELMGGQTMFEYLKIFRAEFKTDIGTNSVLFAIKSLDHIRPCIDMYEARTGSTLLGISNASEMTPMLFTPEENKG